MPQPVLGLATGVAGIVLGRYHACAVMTTGTMSCWGYDLYGQLAMGRVISASVPTTVSVAGRGPAPTFTDNPLVARTTRIKAIHITELYNAIDALRVGSGLASYAWTDPALTVGVTGTKAIHLEELRTALAQAYTAAGRIFLRPTRRRRLRPG